MNPVQPKFGNIYAGYSENRMRAVVDDLFQGDKADKIKVVDWNDARENGVPLEGDGEYTILTDADVDTFNHLNKSLETAKQQKTDALNSRTGSVPSLVLSQWTEALQKMKDFLEGQEVKAN